ncbi:MAG: CrcB family protein [Roseburia sp.]|nr:CrcB family protein [Roseburia sp.]
MCGGFTTFSTFSLEAFALLEKTLKRTMVVLFIMADGMKQVFGGGKWII